jgi:hypothetical protein
MPAFQSFAELIKRTDRRRTTVAPPQSALRARQSEDGRFNRFLATFSIQNNSGLPQGPSLGSEAG